MDTYVFFIIALFGLSIGSFLNVLIYRIPRQESIVVPSSSCASCGEKLKFYHNIPLFSWLFLGGRCAYCGSKISFSYPLVEFANAMLYIAIFYKYGLTLESFMLCACFSMVVCLSVIDIMYKAVPDSINLLALTFALLTFKDISSLQYALIFSGGFTLVRFYLSYILKKEAAGEGDIPMFGVIGALLGLEGGLLAVQLSAIYALIAFLFLRKYNTSIPYIPFLALGAISSLFFKDFFISIYNEVIFWPV